MNAVGIDVSKGISTVAIIKPFGEIVKMPFDVPHTTDKLSELITLIKSLDGESRIVMENTGRYHEPISNALLKAGLFVSVINAKLMHDYGGDTIRKAKTDKIDSLKIASYCLDKWVKLSLYSPEEELRKTLKVFNRQYGEYQKIKTTLKNNLISLLDQSFPGINTMFTSPARKEDGHEKWVDFAGTFYHSECVISLTESAFVKRYEKWCRKNHYQFSKSKATALYAFTRNLAPTLSNNDFTRNLISSAVSQVNSLCETIEAVRSEMNRVATNLPEYETVLAMHGVGTTLAPQLMAEIGDIRKFKKRTSLACFAGIEPPEDQSGQYARNSRHISKQGSAHLRRSLFMVMSCVLIQGRQDEPTFAFLDRLRSQGKPYKVYMIAGCNKFLRIYYSRVKECLDVTDPIA